jgi:hypothetical protein
LNRSLPPHCELAAVGAAGQLQALRGNYLPGFDLDLSEIEEVAEGFDFSALGFLVSRPLRCWPLAIAIS